MLINFPPELRINCFFLFCPFHQPFDIPLIQTIWHLVTVNVEKAHKKDQIVKILVFPSQNKNLKN
jgi:hypothetical protein